MATTMFINRAVKFALGGVLALSTTAIYAADNYGNSSGAKSGQTGPYIGIGVGSARNSVLKDRDTAEKAFLGYDFNKNFGVEAGYADFGKATSGADEVKRQSTYVDGVVKMPFTMGFNLFAKGGIHYANTDSTLYGKDHKTDATYGAGIGYDFSHNVGARAEWERFEQRRGHDDIVSASLVFKFM